METSTDGVEVGVSVPTKFWDIPGTFSASKASSSNGDSNVKLKAAVGTNTHQAFVQAEVSQTNNASSVKVSAGVTQETKNVKQSFYLFKSF